MPGDVISICIMTSRSAIKCLCASSPPLKSVQSDSISTAAMIRESASAVSLRMYVCMYACMSVCVQACVCMKSDQSDSISAAAMIRESASAVSLHMYVCMYVCLYVCI